MSITDVTLSGALRFQAAREPRQQAIVDVGADGTRAWTYAELDEAVDELAAGLAAIGVGPGDRVALRLTNSAEFVLAMLATLRAGGVLVPTIRQYAPDELRFALEDCEARCLIFDDEERYPIEAAAPSGVRVLYGVAGGDLADLRGDSGWEDPELDEEGDALIFYTSGTTSRPKGVVLTQRAVLAAAQGNAEAWRIPARRPLLPGPAALPLQRDVLPAAAGADLGSYRGARRPLQRQRATSTSAGVIGSPTPTSPPARPAACSPNPSGATTATTNCGC